MVPQALTIRQALAWKMVPYFAQSDLTAVEMSARDRILPVGMALPEGLPLGAVPDMHPLVYWSGELFFVELGIAAAKVLPDLLPERTPDSPIALPAQLRPVSSIPA